MNQLKNRCKTMEDKQNSVQENPPKFNNCIARKTLFAEIIDENECSYKMDVFFARLKTLHHNSTCAYYIYMPFFSPQNLIFFILVYMIVNLYILSTIVPKYTKKIYHL